MIKNLLKAIRDCLSDSSNDTWQEKNPPPDPKNINSPPGVGTWNGGTNTDPAIAPGTQDPLNCSFENLVGNQFEETTLSEKEERIRIVQGNDDDIPCNSEKRNFSSVDGSLVTSSRKFLFLASNGKLIPPEKLAGKCCCCLQYVGCEDFAVCQICQRVVCRQHILFSENIPLCPEHKAEYELKKDTWQK